MQFRCFHVGITCLLEESSDFVGVCSTADNKLITSQIATFLGIGTNKSHFQCLLKHIEYILTTETTGGQTSGRSRSPAVQQSDAIFSGARGKEWLRRAQSVRRKISRAKPREFPYSRETFGHIFPYSGNNIFLEKPM
jgi:hypothetical protein